MNIKNLRKVNDIQELFGKIDCTGKPEQRDSKLIVVANIVESHIQGVGRWGDYEIISHNNKGYSKGKVLITNIKTNSFLTIRDFPFENMNHPGGMQIVDDLMVVAISDAAYNKSKLAFFDLTTIPTKHNPTLLDHLTIDIPGPSSAAGLTRVNGETFAVIVDSKTVTIYKANMKDITNKKCKFDKFKVPFNLEFGYQGISLIREHGNKKVYLIGMRYEPIGWDEAPSSYKDSIQLYDLGECFSNVINDSNELDVSSGNLQEITSIQNKHLVSHVGFGLGAISASAGIHCRWGSCINIISDESLEVIVTQRNPVVGKYWINSFLA